MALGGLQSMWSQNVGHDWSNWVGRHATIILHTLRDTGQALPRASCPHFFPLQRQPQVFTFQQPLSWRLRYTTLLISIPTSHMILTDLHPLRLPGVWRVRQSLFPIILNLWELSLLLPASCSLMSLQSTVSEYRLKRGVWWEIFDS